MSSEAQENGLVQLSTVPDPLFDEAFQVDNPEEVDSDVSSEDNDEVSVDDQRGPSEAQTTSQQEGDAFPLPPQDTALENQTWYSAKGDTPPRSPNDIDDNMSYNEEEDDLVLGGDDQDVSEFTESSSEGDDDLGLALEGGYDPRDFEHLDVDDETQSIFRYIQEYKPEAVELATKLKCFIPDFIPAVGDIDAVLKVPRPDGKPDTLGLAILDEPSMQQSDPAVLDLQLRVLSKTAVAKTSQVSQLQNAEDNPKAIQNWIDNISDIHREKMPQSVHYSSTMPDVEAVMQEWPEEFEKVLKTLELPSGDLDVRLKEYVDIVCAILDIPVSKSRIESLHVLLSAYLEFRNSQASDMMIGAAQHKQHSYFSPHTTSRGTKVTAP